MKRAATMILLGLALTACGGALDPVVGVGDGARADAADAAAADLAPGMGWSIVASPTSSHLQDIWGNSAYQIFAVGHGGTILELQGGVWTTVPSTTTNDLIAVWGLPSGEVYAAGAGGVVLQRLATGWSALPSAGTEALSDLWASSPTQIIAVSAASGTVQHFDGTGWTALVTASPGLHTVWGSNPTRVFTAGAMTPQGEPRAYRYDGTQWNAMTFDGPATAVHAIWGNASLQVAAVGDGISLFLLDDESTWQSELDSSLGEPHGLWGLDEGRFVAVGAGGNIEFYTGTRWNDWWAPVSSALRGVWANASDDVWCVGDEGVIAHYSEGG